MKTDNKTTELIESEKNIYCPVYTKQGDGRTTRWFYFAIEGVKYVGFIGQSRYGGETVTVKKAGFPPKLVEAKTTPEARTKADDKAPVKKRASAKKKTKPTKAKKKAGKASTEDAPLYQPGEIKAGVIL